MMSTLLQRPRRLFLGVFTVVMLIGTATNIACKVPWASSYATNCGEAYDRNMNRVLPGTYAIERVEVDPDYEGVLFRGADEVSVEIAREGYDAKTVTFTYDDGTSERWRAE